MLLATTNLKYTLNLQIEIVTNKTPEFKASNKTPEFEASKNQQESKMAPVNGQISVPVVFIVGGPGSGKGTQCEIISQKYSLTHLSSGDLLRAEVSSGSELGKKCKATMDAGQLVTLETVLELIRNAMVKALAAEGKTKGFLIDGYPRDVLQGEKFEAEIKECAIVLYFDAQEETLVKRLLHRGQTSGRSDDNEETIRKRIKTFNDATRPVVSYYEAKGKLARFDADRTVEAIFKDVCAVLDPIFPQQ